MHLRQDLSMGFATPLSCSELQLLTLWRLSTKYMYIKSPMYVVGWELLFEVVWYKQPPRTLSTPGSPSSLTPIPKLPSLLCLYNGAKQGFGSENCYEAKNLFLRGRWWKRGLFCYFLTQVSSLMQFTKWFCKQLEQLKNWKWSPREETNLTWPHH